MNYIPLVSPSVFVFVYTYDICISIVKCIDQIALRLNRQNNMYSSYM